MRKRILLLAVCVITFGYASYAQDIIVTKDSRRIEVKVMEVNVDNVRYRLFNHQDGPIYTLLKNDIVTILYQNGRVEMFTSESSVPLATSQPPAQATSVATQMPAQATSAVTQPPVQTAQATQPPTQTAPVATQPPARTVPTTALQNINSKSNGTIEIIGIYLPDSIVFKPAEGIEIATEKLHATLLSATESLVPNSFSVSGSLKLNFNGGLIYTDNTKLVIKDLNYSVDFKPQKIKFIVDGKEMIYDITKFEWESNSVETQPPTQTATATVRQNNLVNNLWVKSTSSNSLATSTTYLKFFNDGYVMEITRSEWSGGHISGSANIGYKWEFVDNFSAPTNNRFYEVNMINENSVRVKDMNGNRTDLARVTEKEIIDQYNSPAYNFAPMPLFPAKERVLQGSGARPLRSNIAISNPNNFSVAIAITTDTEARYLMCTPQSSFSTGVPNGQYDIYFIYSTEAKTLYQGDKIEVENQTFTITLKPSMERDYGMRKINSFQ